MHQNRTQEMSKSQGVSPKTLMKYTAAKQIIKYYNAYYVISLHYIMEIVKYHKNVFFVFYFYFCLCINGWVYWYQLHITVH